MLTVIDVLERYRINEDVSVLVVYDDGDGGRSYKSGFTVPQKIYDYPVRHYSLVGDTTFTVLVIILFSEF